MDPWYDYLALPLAPLILAAQAWALGASSPPRAVLVSAVGAAAITVMLAFVLFAVALPPSGPNIGAGVLVFELIASLGLLAAAVVRQRRR